MKNKAVNKIICGLGVAVALFVFIVSECITNAAPTIIQSIMDIQTDLIANDKTLQAYLEGSNASGEWKYGAVYDGSGKRSLTLAAKYSVDKTTGQEGIFVDNDDSGDITFDGHKEGNNDYLIADNTQYKVNVDVSAGYHTYSFTPPAGVQIPLAGWENKGKVNTVHQEAFAVDDYAIGANMGLINPSLYGRWAMFRGVEFHSATSVVPFAAPGEQTSPCAIVDESGYEFNRNSTAWFPICAVCGDYVAKSFIYAPRDAIKTLPVLEQGVDIVITCPHCGGMETGFTLSHTCKSVSANRYFVRYESGTNDLGVTGYMEVGVFYYNNASTYNGESVSNQTTKVADCGYLRPGYSFAGWALTPGGEVVFQADDSTLFLQRNLPSLDDNTFITLYAVWTPNTSYVKVDANGSAFNGGAKYNGADLWTSQETCSQIQSAEDGTDRGSAGGYKRNTYKIDTSLITKPKGYTVTFNGNGGTAGETSKTATINFDGYAFITDASEKNGYFDNDTGIYTFGTDLRSEENADVILLQFSQNPIKLPSASKSNTGFIGWYSDLALTNFVGTEGDSYYPPENVTLYAKYSTLDIDITDVYYKKDTSDATFENVAKDPYGKVLNNFSTPNSNLAVQNATGAVNLSTKLCAGSASGIIYNVQYKKSDEDENSWLTITADGIGEKIDDDKYNESRTPSNSDSFVVEDTGYYNLTAYGAQGVNYNSTYTGGKGGSVGGLFFLQKGDVLSFDIGTQGGGGANTGSGGAGGGYTKVSLNDNTLLIAGGGGGGNLAYSGGSGGNTVEEGDANPTGEQGEAGIGGGGGGYQGGVGGEAIVHTCDSSCYKSSTNTITAGESFYATGNATATNVGSYGTNRTSDSTHAQMSSHTATGSYTEATLTVGSRTAYISTAHAGTLSFTATNMYTWGSFGDQDFIVYVYDKDTDALLFTGNSKTAQHTTKTEDVAICDQKTTCSYSWHKRTVTTWTYTGTEISGKRESADSKTWENHSGSQGNANQYVDLTMNFTIAIPESVNGVYIKVYTKITSSGSVGAWFGINVKNVSYKYTENIKNCGYADGTIISAAQPAGGSSFINTAYMQAGTKTSAAGVQSGDGKVTIESVMLNISGASVSSLDFLGIKAPDRVAPGSIGPLRAEKNGSTKVVRWDVPESNNPEVKNTLASYDFKVELYNAPPSGTLVQTSEIITKKIESAIAGYYYIYSNTYYSDTNYVASYINARFAKPAYTWSDSCYSDTVTGFTQNTYLAYNDSYKYVYVAAADVAGNIGPTSYREIGNTSALTNLCKIVFNTNHLPYQLDPANTVSCGTWKGMGLFYVPAPGKNKEGAYQSGYFAVEGTNISNNGNGTFDGKTGNLSFGGVFPTPNAKGCIFMGWNSMPDGSGTYYSADGSNIGYSGIADQVLVLSDLTGNHECGQVITLYAIWADVSRDPDGSELLITAKNGSFFSKDYKMPVLNIQTGFPTANGWPVAKFINKYGIYASSNSDWTNESSVKLRAQFQSTGVYGISQSLYTMSGNRLATINCYLAGAGANDTCIYTLEKINAANTPGKEVWFAEDDEKVTTITKSGTTSADLDSLYNDGAKYFKVSYKVQGSYKVCGSAISRSYFSGQGKNIGYQGNPGYFVTQDLTLKIDNTIPRIAHYTVVQDNLENYTVSEVQSVILGGLFTTFEADVSDYNDTANGTCVSLSDSSGIQGVYVAVSDINHVDAPKVYKMSKTNAEVMTDYDSNVLSAHYKIAVNLYAEFPNASMLMYRIYAVDNAGNMSAPLDQFSITDAGGTVSEKYPIGNVNIALNGTTEGAGLLRNFSVKTVLYNDEDDEYNVAEGEAYFQPGETGHVEVWTVGYIESVQLNFGNMGKKAKAYIEEGVLDPKYHLGILEEGWTRIISQDKASVIIPTKITQASNPDLYNSTIVNSSGIPYAQHYNINAWGNDGTKIMIPPQYKLAQMRTNSNGTPKNQWELWKYEVIGKKNSHKVSAYSHYVVWDAGAGEVHYRTIYY